MNRALLQQRSSRCGSAIVVVLITVSVLAFVAAGMITLVGDRHRSAFESATWNESVFAAEAGAELAMMRLRSSLAERNKWTDRLNALSSTGTTWTENWGVPIDETGNAVPGNPPLAIGTNYGPGGVVNARWYRPVEPLLQHQGEGSSRLYTNVIIDAPPSLRQSSGLQWYRIRSTGMVNLPFRRAGSDKHDNALRQVSLVWDRRGLFVEPPFAARLIEVVVQPVTGMRAALISEREMRVPGPAGVIDSFDSRDPLKSTLGRYDPAKRQRNATVATNGKIFNVGGTIYGDASTNGGNLQPSAKITGEVRNDVYTELSPVAKPTWNPTPATPTTVVLPTAVTGGSPENPTRLKLNTITGMLTISPGATGGHVEVWVTGNVTGGITTLPGTNVKVFLEGNMDVKSTNLNNQTFRAANFQIYGVHPPGNESRVIDIDPSGQFITAIYAPGHDFVVRGNPDLVGAFVTRSIHMNGNTGVHYDEALADDAGMVIDFKVAHWLEDVR